MATVESALALDVNLLMRLAAGRATFAVQLAGEIGTVPFSAPFKIGLAIRLDGDDGHGAL